MPSRYEIYENEEIHCRTRRQVRRLGGIALAALVFTMALAALHAHRTLSTLLLSTGLSLAWTGTIGWTAFRLWHLRHVAWCVKISPREIVGYDYARRRHRLSWKEVQRLSITDENLRLNDVNGCWLEIPTRFRDYPALSHRLLQLSEQRNVPVYVDDQPWEQIDVYQLFPSLSGDPPADAPGTPAA